MSWVTATGTAVIIVYGTLVFSSLMFISTQDATIIVARYLVSALICRAVLIAELNGMRSAKKRASIAEAVNGAERYHSTKAAGHVGARA